MLYAAWAEAGIISRDELLTLRRFDSDLEGHPTPRLPWVDVATGSLGQGICAGIGIALNARRINSDYRTYVLLGDGEIAEGSVWEAAHAAVHENLDSLCGIIDVNGLGQSGPSLWNHDINAYVARWQAFGWHVIAIDGHDMDAILSAFDEARSTRGRPTMIVARTIKGKGISFVEGKPGWHGKPFKKGEEPTAHRRAGDAVRARGTAGRAAAAALGAASGGEGTGPARTALVRARRQGRHARSVRRGDCQARRQRRSHRRARRRRRELDLQREVRAAASRSVSSRPTSPSR